MAIDIAAGFLLAAAFVALARRFPKRESHLFGAVLVLAAVAYEIHGITLGGSALPATPVWSMLVFTGLAVLGVTQSAWFLALGWLLHAGWDLVVPDLADVSFMPGWYAGLCVGFDVVAAAYLAVRASGRFVPSLPTSEAEAA